MAQEEDEPNLICSRSWVRQPFLSESQNPEARKEEMEEFKNT